MRVSLIFACAIGSALSWGTTSLVSGVEGALLGGFIGGLIGALIISLYVKDKVASKSKTAVYAMVWVTGFIAGDTITRLVDIASLGPLDFVLSLASRSIGGLITGVGAAVTLAFALSKAYRIRLIMLNCISGFILGNVLGLLLAYVVSTALLVSFALVAEPTIENTRMLGAIAFSFGGLVSGVMAGVFCLRGVNAQ